MNETLTTPANVEALSGFLKYGPTGLAGLMLLLVVITLLATKVDPPRERLLKQFMYVGAACFALSLAASFFAVSGAYALHFRVIPIDAGTRRVLPMPIIKVNSTLVDNQMTYLIRSEATAIIDVTDAINFAQEVRDQNSRQQALLGNIAANAGPIVSDLQRVGGYLQNNCPGGASGRPAPSNPDVLRITTQAASALSAISASASAEAATSRPVVR